MSLAGKRASAHVPGVDAIRGLAALMVAVAHAWYLGGMALLDDGPLRALVASSWIGVDIFFVISGLVMMAPLAAGVPFGKPSEFYLRRVARLVPLYLVSLAVVIALEPWMGTGITVPPHPFGWELFATHLLFMQNEVYGGSGFDAIGFGNSVVWTLSIEVCFYLVFPLIARWWLRHPWWGLVASIAVARTWTTVWVDPTSLLDLVGVHQGAAGLLDLQGRALRELPSYAAHFGLGMTLAVIVYRQMWRPVLRDARRYAVAITWTGVVLLSVFMYSAGHSALQGPKFVLFSVVGSSLALPGIALILFGVAVRPGRLLNGRAARVMGDTSYCVYLFHVVAFRLALGLMPAHMPAGARLLILLALLPCVYAFAAASFRWFETPARRFLSGAQKPRVAAAAPAEVAAPAVLVRPEVGLT